MNYAQRYPKEFEHTRARALERYGVVLKPSDYNMLCTHCDLRSKVQIAWEEPENAQTVFLGYVFGARIFMVWSLKRRCVTTILRPRVSHTEPQPKRLTDPISPVWEEALDSRPQRERVFPWATDCCDGFYTKTGALCAECWPDGLPEGVELPDLKLEV